MKFRRDRIQDNFTIDERYMAPDHLLTNFRKEFGMDRISGDLLENSKRVLSEYNPHTTVLVAATNLCCMIPSVDFDEDFKDISLRKAVFAKKLN